MRYIFLVVGVILIMQGALKVYAVFQHPNIGPELMADATLLALVAVVFFALFKKIGRNRAR